MEKRKIYGIKHIDYVSKKTGLPVKGTELHCIYADDKVEGYAVETLYFNKDFVMPSGVGVGSTVVVLYNKFGKPVEIQVVED